MQRQVVSLACVEAQRETEAWVCGPLAVHPYHPGRDGYEITHIRTGRAFGVARCGLTEKQAQKLCRRLAVAIDWEFGSFGEDVKLNTFQREALQWEIKSFLREREQARAREAARSRQRRRRACEARGPAEATPAG